jgi:phospholipid/cholesterol/gamma-HCH transport system permease protein
MTALDPPDPTVSDRFWDWARTGSLRTFFGFAGDVGEITLSFFAIFGAISRLTWLSLVAAVKPPYEIGAWIRQVYRLGFQSLSVGFLTAFFTGAVLALQFGHSLERFGASSYVGSVVSTAFVMELGPVLTALLVGGRVAAGIAAEIGSMKVTEQIDAIRCLGADPIDKLIAPRIGACLLGMPILALMADVVGITGGGIVAVFEQGLTLPYYADQVGRALDLGAVMHGLIKSIFFGYFFGVVGCYQGLQTRGGTEGVGESTTDAVVKTSITILIGDFVLGKVLLPWL